MVRIHLTYVLFLFLALGAVSSFAQDEDVSPRVDYKVNKMKTALNLTDAQVNAIKPIIKEYLVKSEAVLQGSAEAGIMDHVSVKSTLKELKDSEYQKLGKILNEDQMKKWIDKENLMASLNPDGGENTVDEGPSLTASGANFKF